MRRLGPLLLMSVGALVVVGAVGWLTLAAKVADPAQVGVPDTLAGRPIAQRVVGAEAVAEVSRLHGKEFPLISGAMAVYGAGEAQLWVAGVPLRWTAAQMVREMERKIAAGRSPFTPTATRQVSGRAVYELIGLGQRHFYFQSGSLVVWLAANEVIAERAIKDVMEFYP